MDERKAVSSAVFAGPLGSPIVSINAPREQRTWNRPTPRVMLAGLFNFEHKSELTVRPVKQVVKVGKNRSRKRRKSPTGQLVGLKFEPGARFWQRLLPKRGREVGCGEHPPTIGQLSLGFNPARPSQFGAEGQIGSEHGFE